MTGRAVAMGAVIALVILYALGSGALVSTGSEWYAALDKPWWQPPSWFVGVIWPYNFVVIGIVGSVIAWQGAPARVASFIVILGVTVSLAIGWAYLFFSAHELIWAAIALTAAAVLTVPLVVMAFAQAGTSSTSRSRKSRGPPWSPWGSSPGRSWSRASSRCRFERWGCSTHGGTRPRPRLAPILRRSRESSRSSRSNVDIAL